MKPDEKIILVLIFLTGVFAGASMYILFFAPQYEADVIEERSRLVITGEMYGGCQELDTCSSFRLEEDGSYTYLTTGDRIEGIAPRSLTSPLLDELTEYRLKSLAAPAEATECESYVDGADQRYEVVLEGTRYVLDTCGTSFYYDKTLQRTFDDLWQFMENPTTTYPTIIEEGLGAWIIERFRGE